MRINKTKKPDTTRSISCYTGFQLTPFCMNTILLKTFAPFFSLKILTDYLL